MAKTKTTKTTKTTKSRIVRLTWQGPNGRTNTSWAKETASAKPAKWRLYELVNKKGAGFKTRAFLIVATNDVLDVR